MFERFLDELFPETVSASALVRRGAAALASLLASARYDGARLVRCARRQDGAELLFLDVDVPLGQRRPVNDIRTTERIAVLYPGDGRLPMAYVLRDDFPDVPHLNIAHEGEPRSLCLFEMPADEALRIATPYVLLERVRHWLRETAHGRLHGEDQPLDPLFAGSSHTVVLPPDGVREGGILVGFRRSDDDGCPILLERARSGSASSRVGTATFACLSIVTPPLAHGRIRALPRTVADLMGVYEALGVDLRDLLREGLTAWVKDSALAPLLERQCLLLVTTPIERTSGQVEALATKGFFLEAKAGQLGESLGAVARSPEGKFGMVLVGRQHDEGALRTMPVNAVDIRHGFDRALARAASGYAELGNVTKIALVGAGALGSQVALNAARGGIGQWTIIDPDHLLPHNLARHALTAEHVGRPKAEALAEVLVDLLGTAAATSSVADVRDGAAGTGVGEADMVIDASASVPCARWLACTSTHGSPTSSVFLSPSGGDLVVLREAEGRAIRLDHLEMLFYWLLVTEPALHGHLRGGGTIMPSGGCRNPSVQLAQSVVGAHAAHAVRELFDAPAAPAGSMVIWHETKAGDLRVEVPGERFVEVVIGGWTVAVRASVVAGIRSARASAGGLETGGILVGGWDRQQRKAWVVALLDPPPDSEHSPTGFVRGLVGVHRTLEHIETTTAVNLTYVGEWHTHPRGHSSSPSEDDRLLMRWIGDAVAYSDVPPVMVIGGEDGVRLMLETVGCHALLEVPGGGDDEGEGASHGTSGGTPKQGEIR